MLLEASSAGSSAGSIGSIIFIVVIWIAVFYFLLIRPQKKQKKQMEDIHNAMEPGDAVMTTGGFYGTILAILDDTTVVVEFGDNKNCRIPMHKNAIAEVEKAGSAIIKDAHGEDDEAEKEAKKESKKLGREKK